MTVRYPIRRFVLYAPMRIRNAKQFCFVDSNVSKYQEKSYRSMTWKARGNLIQTIVGSYLLIHNNNKKPGGIIMVYTYLLPNNIRDTKQIPKPVQYLRKLM